MRVKKSSINVVVSISSYIISFLPIFILRKTFLELLGSELLGLTSLFENIIGYLSIVELGIGSAIIFSLYKPLAEKNYGKINAYLKYYKRFYRVVGCIILGLGVAIIPFLKFFIKDDINSLDVKIYFVLFLLNTFLSYLFSYKQCILNVAQEGYKLSIAATISKVIITILQLFIINIFKSYYLCILIQILINLLYYILVNKYIDKKYMYLYEYEDKLDNYEKGNLYRNIKALFLHKIGSILVFGTDNIVLSTFINLSSVAKYNNYAMIINVFNGIIGNSLIAITPSIGNLLVEGDSNKSYEVHKRIFFANFWISSFVVISLFNTLSQFIALWLGKKNILPQFTVAIILLNVYFRMTRGAVAKFKEGAGEYHKDRLAPIIEGVINLFFSILLVNVIGMPGVFIGTLISNITVIFWTQPIIVYKYVFKKPVINYYAMYFKYMFIGIIPLIISVLITINLKKIYTVKYFVINCIINILVINIFYLFIFRKNKEFLYFKNLIQIALKNRIIR